MLPLHQQQRRDALLGHELRGVADAGIRCDDDRGTTEQIRDADGRESQVGSRFLLDPVQGIVKAFGDRVFEVAEKGPVLPA